MINVLMLFFGAGVFFIGFLIGTRFEYPEKNIKSENLPCVSGEVITSKEHLNFLSYDGTEQI